MKNLVRKLTLVSAISASIFISSSAQAITIDSNLQGWVGSDGIGNGAANGNNAFTGNAFGNRYNSWANFDLSGLAGTVLTAQLEVLSKAAPVGGSYSLGIYDVSTPLADFGGTSPTAPGASVYNDLGGGSLYGSNIFGDGTVLVTLSAQAVSDINTLLGQTFRVGFTNLTLNSVTPDPKSWGVGILTNGDRTNRPQLILEFASASAPATVPEPDSLVLFALGLAGLWSMRKQARL